MTRLMLLFAFIISTAGALKAQDEKRVNVTVEVKGVSSSKGSLRLSVFNSERDWLEKEAVALSIDLTKEDSHTFEVKDLLAGTYGISVIHDENNNGELDMGMMGPEEKYGFSNDARGTFGPPSFDKSAMAIDKDLHTIVKIK